MFQFFINNGDGEKDITKYVISQSVSLSRTLNAPTTCSLSLSNNDINFIIPVPRSYLRIYSTQYSKNLFTGFLTNDPTSSFVGLSKYVPGTKFQMYSFQLNFTSDEYLLNIKSVDFLPAFVNQSQGSILRTIAEAMCPGFFDFTYCASGDIIPYMAYDSSKNWSQIAKIFGDASRYRYSVINKEIHYQPYGDGQLGVSYDEDAGEGTFDPSMLSTSASTSPIVNDVIMIGQQEGGNNREDYFIGTGFTGNFPLRHKVFGLASAEQGSSLLLADDWSQPQLNTQNWFAQDPSNNFFYAGNGASALNILTSLPQEPGTSFISAQNGLELAGGVNLQHGEIVFNDVSAGIIGGVYDSTVLNGFGNLALEDSNLEAGFLIEPTQIVNVTASGAAGISIQPYRQGLVPSGAFNVITKVNKSYVLKTGIIAPSVTRFNQVYRTIAGVAYGSVDQSSILGAITWSITETDLFTGQQTIYTWTMSQQPLPPTAVYALINNFNLNITLTTTALTAPVPGSLNVKCEVGVGLLAPIYISGNVQYTGGFVTPSGGNLPIPISGFGPENNFPLGTGLGRQAAELDSGQNTDTLNFYGDDLPGVGVRIRLQTFESQAAVSRVRDTASVAREAAVVGDDGVRSAVVSNLSPLPRTSEDCDAAAQAYLVDRVPTLYQGTYQASYYFFSQFTDDIDFYPICGRYLYVNSPQRNIRKQEFLVSSVTTKITELKGEILDHSITFGPDMQIQKLLAAFLPPPTSTLFPADTVVAPTPQMLATIGTAFLPDISQTTISSLVSGDQIVIDLNDALPYNSSYEVRNADLNWGIQDSRLLGVFTASGSYTFPRSSYEQSWFVRLVSNNKTNGIISSRRTKVLRIVYPQVPSIPTLTLGASNRLQFDFNGDVRNIEGIELRSGDDLSTYYQAIVGSQEDMNLDMVMLRGQNTIGESITGNLGVHLLEFVPATQRQFKAYFFNLMWEYSPGLFINIPPPLAPLINEGYRFGPALQIRVIDPSSPPRTDIQYTHLQISNDNTFSSGSLVPGLEVLTNGNPGSFSVNVPISGDLWARVQFVDYISSGAWSNTLHIPRGNLIASDYMVSQGSVPPAITNSSGGAGGLFTYLGYNNSLVLFCSAFGILWPNDTIDNIAAVSGSFVATLDVSGGLTVNTPYGFFPKVENPQTPNPFISFNGPYANYTGTSALAALSGQFQDGSVPMTNGAFVCQTSVSITGSTGGGGGGTGGGGNCGILSSKIKLADESEITLKELVPGTIVKTRAGRHAKVVSKIIMSELTYLLELSNGFITRAATAHTLDSGEWETIDILLEKLAEGSEVILDTIEGKVKLDSISNPFKSMICKIELRSIDLANASDEDHVYLLDGIWTHNAVVKVEQFDGL